MTDTLKVLPASVWQRLILRWTDMEPTGEVKLLAAAAAAWIYDEQYRAAEGGREPHYSGALGHSLGNVCAALGIEYTFMLRGLSEGWKGRGQFNEWLAEQKKSRASAKEVSNG